MEEQKPKSTKNPIRIIFTVVGIVVVGGALGFIGWYGYSNLRQQRSDIKSLQDSNSSIRSTIDEINATTQSGQEQIQAFRTEIDTLSNSYNYGTYNPVYASVVVEGMSKYSEIPLDDASHYFLLVDVKLTNSSTQDVYFSAYDMKLKDVDNNEYPALMNSAYSSQPRFVSGITDLPDGRIDLRYITLKPSEISKGTLVFLVTRPINTFKLYQNGVLVTEKTLY